MIRILAAAAALLAAAAATPAQAATRPRPVTVSAASHCNSQGKWQVDLTITSTTVRQVDIWVDSDTYPHIVTSIDGQLQQAVTVSPTPTVIETTASASQMYATFYVYPTTAKFDGQVDPLAQVTQRYPTYPDGRRAC